MAVHDSYWTHACFIDEMNRVRTEISLTRARAHTPRTLHDITKSGLRRVRNLCMLVLCLCSVIVASQHVVDTGQIHDFTKTVWPRAYE